MSEGVNNTICKAKYLKKTCYLVEYFFNRTKGKMQPKVHTLSSKHKSYIYSFKMIILPKMYNSPLYIFCKIMVMMCFIILCSVFYYFVYFGGSIKFTSLLFVSFAFNLVFPNK